MREIEKPFVRSNGLFPWQDTEWDPDPDIFKMVVVMTGDIDSYWNLSPSACNGNSFGTVQ